MGREVMDLKSLLIKHEGIKLKAYQDTKGIWTIGVGRNLQDVGLTKDEALYLLDNDIKRIVNDCLQEFPWFSELSENRQYAIIDIVFNCGLAGFKQFKRCIAAIERDDWASAAMEIMDSALAPQRAADLAMMMKGAASV
jgi:lysozyme